MQFSDKTEDAIVLVLMNGISQIFVSLVQHSSFQVSPYFSNYIKLLKYVLVDQII